MNGDHGNDVYKYVDSSFTNVNVKDFFQVFLIEFVT